MPFPPVATSFGPSSLGHSAVEIRNGVAAFFGHAGLVSGVEIGNRQIDLLESRCHPPFLMPSARQTLHFLLRLFKQRERIIRFDSGFKQKDCVLLLWLIFFETRSRRPGPNEERCGCKNQKFKCPRFHASR